MQERREQLLQELRAAEQARDLLSELERLLKEENHPEPERCLTQLKQLAQSLPEGHSVRLLIESAIRPEMVGRARSALEGEVKLANHHQRTTFHPVTEGRFSEVRIAPVHYYTADTFCFATRVGRPVNSMSAQASYEEVLPWNAKHTLTGSRRK
jgi:hypothetical protein